MKSVYDDFKSNLLRAKNLGLIYVSLNARTTAVLDISDILRAELVLAVSAFDHFIHEIACFGMMEAYSGKRPKTKQFLKFKCSMESIIEGYTNLTSQIWFENEIRYIHGFQSFLQPEKISEALKLVTTKNLWEESSNNLGIPPQELKKRLNVIVDRRNKIAHEADLDPSFPNTRWPINNQMVNEAIDYLEILGDNIYLIVKQP